MGLFIRYGEALRQPSIELTFVMYLRSPLLDITIGQLVDDGILSCVPASNNRHRHAGNAEVGTWSDDVSILGG